jgi:hypothetical protein
MEPVFTAQRGGSGGGAGIVANTSLFVLLWFYENNVAGIIVGLVCGPTGVCANSL